MDQRVLIANLLIAITVLVLVAVPVLWWVRAALARRRRMRSRRYKDYRPYFSEAPFPRSTPVVDEASSKSGPT